MIYFIAFWIILGFLISYKRNWYKSSRMGSMINVICTFIFAPALLITNFFLLVSVNETISDISKEFI